MAKTKKEDFDKLMAAVRERVSEETLPAGYDMDTAMLSAWSELRSSTVKIEGEDYPLLENVTWASVYDAIADMVILGLAPAKEQCYFIPRKQKQGPLMKLNMQLGKFGTKAILMRFPGVHDVTAHVVFAGDEFAYEGDGKTWVVTKHVQSLKSREPDPQAKNPAKNILDNIVGAYGTLIWEDGTFRTTVMSKREIYGAWVMGQPGSSRNPDEALHNLTRFQRSRPISAAERSAMVHVGKEYVNSLPELATVGLKDELMADVEGEEDLIQKQQKAMGKPAKSVFGREEANSGDGEGQHDESQSQSEVGKDEDAEEGQNDQGDEPEEEEGPGF